MWAWVGRVGLAAGLVANALVFRHPLILAAAQLAVAVVVVTGRGGAAALAVAAVLLVPAPIGELRRWLSHAPLACRCQRTSGRGGVAGAAGAAGDVGLIGLSAWLARRAQLDRSNEKIIR